MTVRFFHTSDWHLGQFFYNHSRQYEHEQFLAWLLEQIQARQPDALLIAGDIFDVINPASSAQKQLYQFLEIELVVKSPSKVLPFPFWKPSL